MCLWKDKNTQIYSMLKTVCDKTVDFLCALKNLNVLFLYLLFFFLTHVLKAVPRALETFVTSSILTVSRSSQCNKWPILGYALCFSFSFSFSFFFFFFLNRCCCIFCIPLCILVILSVQTVKDNTNLLHVTNFLKVTVDFLFLFIK